jgi:hypothetical protein
MIYTTHNYYYNSLKNLKYWRQQINGAHKILASAKHWRIQNLGVDKILASTKHMRDLQQLTSHRPH